MRMRIAHEGTSSTVYLDDRAVPVRDPGDLRAVALEIRDKDRLFYERLIRVEEFRRATQEGAVRPAQLAAAVQALDQAWWRRRAGL